MLEGCVCLRFVAVAHDVAFVFAGGDCSSTVDDVRVDHEVQLTSWDDLLAIVRSDGDRVVCESA